MAIPSNWPRDDIENKCRLIQYLLAELYRVLQDLMATTQGFARMTQWGPPDNGSGNGGRGFGHGGPPPPPPPATGGAGGHGATAGIHLRFTSIASQGHSQRERSCTPALPLQSQRPSSSGQNSKQPMNVADWSRIGDELRQIADSMRDSRRYQVWRRTRCWDGRGLQWVQTDQSSPQQTNITSPLILCSATLALLRSSWSSAN